MAFAVSAVVAAVAAPTLVSVLGAVAAVGMATTVVGVVTGKQNLIKIGGELGLVGGLGSLAAGALTGTAAAGAAGAAGAEAGAEAGAGALEGAAADGAIGGLATTSMEPIDGITQSIADNMGGAASSSQGIIGSSMVQPATSSASGITSGVGSSGVPGISPNSGGMYDVPGNALMPGASPELDAATKPNDFASSVTKGYTADDIRAGGNPSALDKIKSTLGDAWSKLSPLSQAEITKSLLAIPGGVQNQKNTQAMLDLQRQKLNQTSHGSEVPTFGIIAKGMKG